MRLARFLTNLRNLYCFIVKKPYQVEDAWYGGMEWRLRGRTHRTDGPARHLHGVDYWYVNGKRHRVGAPAMIGPNLEAWFENDKLHKVDGPAVIDHTGRSWWINGYLHRVDGPAREGADGTNEWWLNGYRHREDGPAIQHGTGAKEWWIRGEKQYRLTKSFLKTYMETHDLSRANLILDPDPVIRRSMKKFNWKK